MESRDRGDRLVATLNKAAEYTVNIFNGLPNDLVKLNDFLSRRLIVGSYDSSLGTAEMYPKHAGELFLNESYARVSKRFLGQRIEQMKTYARHGKIHPEKTSHNVRQSLFTYIDELTKLSRAHMGGNKERAREIANTARRLFLQGIKIPANLDGKTYDSNLVANLGSMMLNLEKYSYDEISHKLKAFLDNPLASFDQELTNKV